MKFRHFGAVIALSSVLLILNILRFHAPGDTASRRRGSSGQSGDNVSLLEQPVNTVFNNKELQSNEY